MHTTMFRPSQLAHTFSIVARDEQTGDLGVAVQSHWFAVGRLVCWAEAGVGAVATQAMVQVSYGPLGLERMRRGFSAPETLADLLAADEGRELRQVAMVDAQGRVAAHTGAQCIAEAGHEIGPGFSVQANIMANSQVWPAMAHAFRQAQGDLAERLLCALEAAQEAGGDLRGKQSAALLVVSGERTPEPWAGVRVELRVEDHPEPLVELRRLLRLHQAYEHMNQGDALLGEKRTEEALAEYRRAAQMAPDIPELPFWHAVTLADLGRLEEALPIFRDVFARDPNLALLLQRLPASGLLHADAQTIARILEAA
ncbi:MAG: DUF1028 domain-containing protein [Chloroflexi bacterium]|nr:DUF1028 domain-containing protein [Chloroflexota bacterium]